ncbi:hypothetical protein SDC9_144339 [bioreactor metagenome]|uniref:Uncharacterized protein n=1 Tax=bioreactor metagenome TaxID=1076179 RepID=A0A645E6I3_9ZZZZ
MEIEYVARISFPTWRPTEQQRHSAIRHGMLGKIVIYAKYMAAFLHEVLAHRNPGIWRQVLKRSTVRS